MKQSQASLTSGSNYSRTHFGFFGSFHQRPDLAIPRVISAVGFTEAEAISELIHTNKNEDRSTHNTLQYTSYTVPNISEEHLTSPNRLTKHIQKIYEAYPFTIY